MWQIAAALSNLLAHTPFRLPYWPNRMIAWVFTTPNLHHVHHHYRQPHTDRNYGNVFSLWDRMFGTLTSLPEGGPIFGVDTHMDPALTGSYRRMMAVLERFLPIPANFRSETLRVSAGGTYIADATKAKRELGWQARPIEAGLRETLEHEMRLLGIAARA